MKQAPNFFLTSAGEYEPLSEPRACWEMARLRDQIRDDYMLIHVEPSLIGQGFGLGDMDISQLIISTRYQGHTLYPITEWPTFVYVTRIIDQTVLETLSFTDKQVELVAWAMLFPTLEAATAQARKMNP